MRFIMLLLALSLVSCGDSITKAYDLSQVVDAHFEYSKLKSELVESRVETAEGKSWNRTVDRYKITGRAKNKSGINIREAEFWVHTYQGDDELGIGGTAGFSIKDFIDNTTRDFETIEWVTPGKKPDRIVVTYRPD